MRSSAADSAIVTVLSWKAEGRIMIPTMILVGLALGRWWRLALVVGAISWPVTLAATNVMSFEPGLLGAAVLGVGNAGVGVLLHQGVLGVFRMFPHGRTPDHSL